MRKIPMRTWLSFIVVRRYCAWKFTINLSANITLWYTVELTKEIFTHNMKKEIKTMEEKIMFPCGSNEGQKVNGQALTDESSSEVNGGVYPPIISWTCCGMTWPQYENCGKCGKKSPYSR